MYKHKINSKLLLALPYGLTKSLYNNNEEKIRKARRGEKETKGTVLVFNSNA